MIGNKEKPFEEDRSGQESGNTLKTRVTQRDIARKAKVSHMTVSLALRDDPSISEKTRKRIEKVANLLGYSPDPMLSALSSYRKQRRPAAFQANIAWLSNDTKASKVWTGDFGLYYQGAVARAHELGYVLDEVSLNGDRRDKPLRRLLDARNITGLLLAPSATHGAELKHDFTRYSVVRLGYSYPSFLSNTVANSQFRTALTAMQKLIALGYRRIGILLNEEVDKRTSWHFLGGYLAAQHVLREQDRVMPFYVSYARPYEQMVEAVQAWIREQDIDCFIGSSHVGLYRTLIERGIPIPERLGYADVQIAEEDDLFSGIHQNAREIGRAAVDLLVSMMHRHATGLPAIPHHVLVEGSWRDGKTAIAQRP